MKDVIYKPVKPLHLKEKTKIKQMIYFLTNFDTANHSFLQPFLHFRGIAF